MQSLNSYISNQQINEAVDYSAVINTLLNHSKTMGTICQMSSRGLIGIKWQESDPI